MAAPVISPLPPAPLPNDSKTTFNAKAYPFVAALDVFRQELNEFGEYVGGEVDIVKTIRAPEDLAALPNAAGRANKFLTFGADSEPEVRTAKRVLQDMAIQSGADADSKTYANAIVRSGIQADRTVIKSDLQIGIADVNGLVDDIRRGVRAPVGEVLSLLPDAEGRRLRFLRFNSNGNPDPLTPEQLKSTIGIQIADVSGLASALASKATTAQVASIEIELDSKVDDSQIKTNLASPDNASIPSTLAVASAIADSMAGETPRGAWNASTNTPALASSVGTAGYWYEVSVAGTTNLNGETAWQVGDKAIFNGIIWTRIPANAVKSVDGRTGAVILNYDTPAQAALASLPVGAKYSTRGAGSVGDGGHGDFIVFATAPVSEDVYGCFEHANGTFGVLQPVNGAVNPKQFAGSMALSIAFAVASGCKVLVSEDTEVLIPSDAATLQIACDTVKCHAPQSEIIELMIESGHQLTHGLLLTSGDYSNFRISSVDATVYLAAGFVGVTIESTAPNSLIIGQSCIMPVLNCLIRADDKCNAGYFVYSNAIGRVNRNCGVTYVNGLGLYVAGGQCFASGANFSYANRGNRCTANGKLACEGVNMSYARGIDWDADDVFGLDVSRGSIVYAMTQGANISRFNNSAGRGVSARRSWVVVTGAIADNAALDGCRSDIGANVIFSAGSALNCGLNGVSALNGGTITATGVDASGAAVNGFNANSGGKISCAGAIANNCGTNGFSADKMSDIEASSGTANDCTNGVVCSNESRINFQSGTSMRSITRGIFANASARVNAVGATIQGSGERDVRIQRGSHVALNDAQTTNSVTTAPILADTFGVSAFNTNAAGGIIYSN